MGALLRALGAIMVKNSVLNFIRGSIGSFLGFFCWEKLKIVFSNAGDHSQCLPINPPLLLS
jgi:hypothetical protein